MVGILISNKPDDGINKRDDGIDNRGDGITMMCCNGWSKLKFQRFEIRQISLTEAWIEMLTPTY